MQDVVRLDLTRSLDAIAGDMNVEVGAAVKDLLGNVPGIYCSHPQSHTITLTILPARLEIYRPKTVHLHYHRPGIYPCFSWSGSCNKPGMA